MHGVTMEFTETILKTAEKWRVVAVKFENN